LLLNVHKSPKNVIYYQEYLLDLSSIQPQSCRVVLRAKQPLGCLQQLTEPE